MLKTAWRVLGRYGGHEAEDAVQDAWIAAWSTDARPTGDVGAWLRTIAARKALDRTRSRARRGETSYDGGEPATPEGAGRQAHHPESTWADREAVRRALATLTPLDRAVLLLIDVEGRTAAEAAEALGVTRLAAKFRTQRARKKLGRALETADRRAVRARHARPDGDTVPATAVTKEEPGET